MRLRGNLNLYLCMLQAIFWIVNCVSVAFLVPILNQKGFLEWEIGVVMALVALACVVAMPVWGYINDRFGHVRRLLLAGCGISIPIYICLCFAQEKPLIIALLLLLGATTNSMQNMADSWVSKLLAEGRQINYGFSRSFGSFFYALTSACFGTVLARFGVRPVPWILLAGMGVMTAVTLCIPEPQFQRQAKGDALPLPLVMRRLFALPEYTMFVLCYFLATFGATSMGTFYPIFIEQLGGSSSEMGVGYFVMACSEIPMLLIYRRLEQRFGYRLIIVVALAGIGLRSVVIGLAQTPLAAILGMVFQTISYGLMIPSVVNFISHTVERRYSASALLICTAFGVSLAQILANFCSGFIAEAIGVRAMIFATALLPFLSSGIMGGYLCFARRKAVAAPGREE